jgi:DNA segregation ATPase FtsK/SpoIIIE, S-DNA-T family
MAEQLTKKGKSATVKSKNGDLPIESALKKSKKTIAITKDERTRRIVGLLSILIGIFLLFALGSYYYTWKVDQDKLMNNSVVDYLFATPYKAANKAGKIGALASHLFIYKGVGIMAVLLAPLFLFFGFNIFTNRAHTRLIGFAKYAFGGILVFAPLLSYLNLENEFSYGGAYGLKIATFLEQFAGHIGTGFVLFGIIGAVLIYLFNQYIRLPKMPQLPSLPKLPSFKAAGVDAAVINTSEALDNTLTEIDNENYELGGASLSVDEGIQQQKNKQQSKEQLKTKELIDESPSFIVEEKEVEEEIEPEKIILEPTPLSIETTPKVSKPIGDLQLEVLDAPKEEAIVADVKSSAVDPENYDPTLDLSQYKYPTIDLLDDRNTETVNVTKEELEANKNQIIQTLKNFGIAISKISATVGPTVTLYEIVPAEGVRISKIRNLEDDIALSLAALGIRIIAPIPGKGTIGIEVPNLKKQIVSMRTLIASDKFINNNYQLPIAIGKKIDNENYIIDLATMPHLLMAGATGQGKSVGLNAILTSLLYKKHPSQLKFVLIDPKKVELSIYKVIEKHFLAKLPNEEEAIITDTKKVVNTLNSLCIEMDARYDLLKDAGVRNLREYNEKFVSRRLNPQKGHRFMPFIVLVVDEFADLIMTAGKEVEMPIARLAQLARAIGIHLIIATQRPSVNVITGTIKANFPARIAFRVSSKVDSRTILDTGGAEQLIGRGDLLISTGNDLTRVQCAFVDTPEVERIIDFIGDQQGYSTAYELPEYVGADADFDGGGSAKNLTDLDNMFQECARLVVGSNSGSTSMLQRRFNLGYNRAGRIMDQMEAAGIVGPATGGKPRELLVRTEQELEEVFLRLGV